MKGVLSQAAVEAIADVIKETRDALEARCDTILATIDERVDYARLNADLWKEQTKNKLHHIDQQHADLDHSLKYYQGQLAELQKRNQELQEEHALAVAERLKPRGPYKQGEVYGTGDCVMRDGATWWSLCDNNDVDPRDQGEVQCWRLLSMRGERGTIGPRGKAGPTGKAGQDGADGVGILDMQMVDDVIAVALSDGSVKRLELSSLRDMIAQAVAKEVAEQVAQALKVETVEHR